MGLVDSIHFADFADLEDLVDLVDLVDLEGPTGNRSFLRLKTCGTPGRVISSRFQ